MATSAVAVVAAAAAGGICSGAAAIINTFHWAWNRNRESTICTI